MDDEGREHWVDLNDYHQRIVAGIKTNETTHWVTASGTGLTIPGSHNDNTIEVRMSFSQAMLEWEARSRTSQ